MLFRSVATVDETGSARGRIEPFGATRKLDSIAGGRVSAVNVKEGDKVKAGDVLLKLDNDTVKPDRKSVV